MKHRILHALVSCALLGAAAEAQDMKGWLSWRGPNQNGTSVETGLVDTWDVDSDTTLWTFDMRGRGTPVIANGRVYSFCYDGEGPNLREGLACLDEKDGSVLWMLRFTDFLTDNIYDRYAIGSPTVDPETGNIYLMTSAGLVFGVNPDGEFLWQHSLMEEFGRLTFPNGRTGAPFVDGDRVIYHWITSHWGPLGPARDRFFAFDKRTGELIWESTPGETPQDSTFSMPILDWENGRRVLYAGTGCGHLACIDARTGEPIWRYPMATGGVNSAALVYGDNVIAIHGKENRDSSEIGRMISVKRGATGEGNVTLDRSHENWRNELVSFTSSPVLVGDLVYQTTQHGELVEVDAKTGEVNWHIELAPDQIHASLVAADGKLYVPMNNGSFHIVRPTEDGPKVLSSTQLEGNCLGAPAISGGRIFVHTTEKLYCFGKPTDSAPAWTLPAPATAAAEPGAPAKLQLIPADTLLRPGETIDVRANVLDARGQLVQAGVEATWQAPATLDVTVENGKLSVAGDGRLGTGVLLASAGELKGSARLRVVAEREYAEDFESIELKPHPKEEGVNFAFPPAHWLGSKLKWEVRELEDGNRVLAKTLDRALFQRALGYIGHPETSNTTMQIDIMSDGNRRMMSSAGLVHQRYLIALKGNYQEIEISSNMERIKTSVPFKWKPGIWYTLKTRVDVAEDGTGVVRAKAWKRDEAEPEAWNIEFNHDHAHTQGSPGLFGFAPQSRFRVYVDNLSITANDV